MLRYADKHASLRPIAEAARRFGSERWPVADAQWGRTGTLRHHEGCPRRDCVPDDDHEFGC